MTRPSLTHPSDDGSDGRYDPTRDPNSRYYIDRGETSDTSDEVQQNAEQNADAEEAGGNWLEQLIARFTREGRVNEAYNQELNAQANQLAQGVDTRQPPMMMCANYMANPHDELKTMVTDGVDPDAVGEMGDTWIEAGNAMTRFQTGVATAINNSESEWEGAAGNAARTFMADVGNWVGNAGQSAQLAGTQTNIQAAALADARRQMPEPVEFDVAAANRDLASTTNPLEAATKYADYMVQYNAQQAAHEQAARVVSTYDSNLATASTMPAFAPPPQMGGGGGEVKPIEGKRIESLEKNDKLDPNGETGTTNTTQNSNNTTNQTNNPNIPTPPPGTSDGFGTGTGNGNQNGTGGNPGIPGMPGGPSYGSTDPSSGGNFPGGPGGLPLPTGGPGGGGGQGPGGGGSNFPGGTPLPLGMGGGPGGGDLERGVGRGFGGGRGFGPGGGGFGSGGGYGGSGGGSGAGGAGGGAGGTGGMGRGAGGMGGGSGMGAGGTGALAAENAAMRGGAGGGGRGAGGMGGMGGGRGQGEEDDEHQRPSFLVEGDPDAVFGTDQMTAPPVIGE